MNIPCLGIKKVLKKNSLKIKGGVSWTNHVPSDGWARENKMPPTHHSVAGCINL